MKRWFIGLTGRRREEPVMLEVRSLLGEGLHPHLARLTADLLDPLVTEVVRDVMMRRDRRSTGCLETVVAGVLGREIRGTLDGLKFLREAHEQFVRRHAALRSKTERNESLLLYAEQLGATKRQIRGDRRALRRWFGRDTLDARHLRRRGDLERRLAFLLDRLGVVGRRWFAGRHDQIGDHESAARDWRMLGIERILIELTDGDPDVRTCVAAFRALGHALAGIDAPLRGDVLGSRATAAIYRCAFDRSGDIWVQIEALGLLRSIDSDSFRRAVLVRFTDPVQGDELFVRRRLVPMVVEDAGFGDLVESRILRDPSPFVRQGLAECAGGLADPLLAVRILRELALTDDEPSVRAAAILALEPLATGSAASQRLMEIASVVEAGLGGECDSYVLRVAIVVSAGIHSALPENCRDAWRGRIVPVLERIHAQHDQHAVRRWAAQARERIWCHATEERRELLRSLLAEARSARPGRLRSCELPGIAGVDDLELGRILSVVAQDDFGFDVRRTRRGIRFVRGHRFGTRLWRILHEFHHPSPDKRQGFRHTIGRIFEGDLRVPSAILAEMSMTKVPGEPLFLPSEGGWRPFLPLVDDLISVLDENSHQRPLRIVTSEGVTSVAPPDGWWACAKARFRLTRGFAGFARLRNAEDPRVFESAVRGLGFKLEMTPHPPIDDEAAGSQEEALEESRASWASLPAWFAFALPEGFGWSRLGEYFYSVYENSLGQLLVFLVAALIILFGRHVIVNRLFFRSRARLPLVVGGWGTRGKSGTERIKAALFNALGHRLVAKTTGCEAMFLYADNFGPLHELMLFRPYDKATIWEQVDMVNMAARLDAKAFLWECMGLTPHYVEVLQRQWMKDDLSTIVNTYPDHEDLQGPAGVNIPEVMNCFMHKGGHVVTSEQQMTPILEAAAVELGSRIDKVGWIEPGLLTPDILARFPYAEHPNNIALAVEMARQLGLEPDFALKEMADRVVPDLGVLKVYPVAEIDGRRIQFINGCSANERFGALGNWRRVGFDRHDPAQEPDVWISVLVNNRADRVARSRVFASIVTDDISFDRLYLIGSNLQGMLGYIREALAGRLSSLTLFPDGEGGDPAAAARDWARRSRVPATESEMAGRLSAVKAGTASDSGRWREELAESHREFIDFLTRLEGAVAPGDRPKIDAEFRALLTRWFERRIVVVWDFHASGEEIVRTIVDSTPPGFMNRVMGMQNIKGTGLDFVYRWQAWDACHRACSQIASGDVRAARAGVIMLSGFSEFGLLSEAAVEAAVASGIALHGARDPVLRNQLEAVRARMNRQLSAIRADAGTGSVKSARRQTVVRSGILAFLEELVDSLDAIARRSKAAKVYRDLEAERISPTRAAHEIQKLNKRQKGGWLGARAA